MGRGILFMYVFMYVYMGEYERRGTEAVDVPPYWSLDELFTCFSNTACFYM